ncbi:nuclear transport factor 2 family protein [Idiomarina seosinensis]|uniref:Nuclear transport factor 2 family protein n=1 Tax=Idiomarina seosinensis TaxID=281739 RepID=A0A432ZIC6_9GAMM|nr:nuclear transport factor 2 family protein [Idiomarina seosinensis]RUO77663.1 nuclear transport factor 2 family protein [Idiomarina seosinensis]
MDKQELVDSLKSFYDEFKTENLDQLDEMYHEEVSFTDPIHQLVGLEDLKKYFEHSTENVDYCHFAFDDELVGEDKAFLAWQMRFAHPKLGDGMEIVLPGVSYLKFEDGKIREQQDHYDLGAMLYEHVPLVGYVIDKIKQRLVAE